MCKTAEQCYTTAANTGAKKDAPATLRWQSNMILFNQHLLL